jgi:hypothetical protein
VVNNSCKEISKTTERPTLRSPPSLLPFCLFAF